MDKFPIWGKKPFVNSFFLSKAITFQKFSFKMLSARRNYQNMDEILDFITNDDDESDDDIALEDEGSDMDSDWR